jgi:host factor-I protein
MSNYNVNLQDSFLNQVRKESTEVEILLLSGGAYKGFVRGFDNFTVILHVGEQQHLVYKHAIAQITAPKFVRAASSERVHSAVDETTEPRDKRPPRPKKPRTPERKETPQKFNALDFSHIPIAEGGVKAPSESSVEVADAPAAEAKA